MVVRSDSRVGVEYQSPGCTSLPLLRLAAKVWLWAEAHLRSLCALHIPGLLNARPSISGRDDCGRVETVYHCGRLYMVTVQASRSGLICVPVEPSGSPVVLPAGIGQSATLGRHVHSPWPSGLLYAFPPPLAILPLLARARQEGQTLIQVAPESPRAP